MLFKRILTENKIFYKIKHKKFHKKILFYKIKSFTLIINIDKLIQKKILLNYLLLHKTYLKSFFKLFFLNLISISYGYKTRIFLKGKSLRMIIKKTINNAPKLYLKLGYSHRIFFSFSKNLWGRIYKRKRGLILYALNYSYIRNLVLKIRSFYPMGLYKKRGFIFYMKNIKLLKENHECINKNSTC